MNRVAFITSARRFCISLGAVALAGCSMMPSFMGGSSELKPAELAPNPGTLSVRQAWTARIGPVDLPLTVNVNGDNFVAASSDGAVAAFDVAPAANFGAPTPAGPLPRVSAATASSAPSSLGRDREGVV